MSVRLIRPGELQEVTKMMRALCPDEGDYDFSGETVFVWERTGGGLGGFASFSLRPWAEGCSDTPVPYIEGWWVEPDLRGSGVGRALARRLNNGVVITAIPSWGLMSSLPTSRASLPTPLLVLSRRSGFSSSESAF